MQPRRLGIRACLALAVAALWTEPYAKAPPADFPDSSLYHLQSKWITDEGRSLRLSDLAGKRRLITLFFGNCEASCPMALGRLKTLEAKMDQGWPHHAGMVLITLDPQRDDSGGLADFRKRMALGKQGWTLLRGKEEDTRELAHLLGVAFRPSPKNGGMEHNSVLVLLDARGVPRLRYEGADPPPAFLDSLRKQMEGR